MILFNIIKCDLIRVFIEANKKELNYEEFENRFEVLCDHMAHCTCRRLDTINKVINQMNGYIPKDLKTIATISNNIKLSEDHIKAIDDFHMNNPSYLIQVANLITHDEVSIINTAYKYKVYSNKTNSLKSFLEAISSFEHRNVKLPLFIIDKIGVEISENYLSKFQINTENYIFNIIRYDQDRDSYIGEFKNYSNGCSIVVDQIIVNEMDGSVYSCGNNQNKIIF